MEFSVFRSDLLKELELVHGAIERKASVPVLSNVLIDAQNGKLALSATNLAIGLCSYAVAAIKTPGSVTVPARRSLEILRSLPEADIRFKALENHWVQVTCGRSSFKLAGIAGDTFPKFPEVPKTNVTVPSETLAAMLRRTAFAVSNDEGRFTLNAVLFVAKGNCIRMVATDGFRLALVEKEVAGLNVAEELRVLIPKEAAHQLCVLLTLRKQDELTGIAKDEQHLFFTQNERVLVSRALAGQFPNYESILPQNDRALEADRRTLLRAVERVELVTDENRPSVVLEAEPGELTLKGSSQDCGKGSDTIAVEFAGEALRVSFNPRYLAEFLSAVSGAERVRLSFKDSKSAAELQPIGDEGYRYIAMPIQGIESAA